ncbi:MAG: hypothetical protein ACRDSL_12905 [Pseudonocardiaceae bacterium]
MRQSFRRSLIAAATVGAAVLLTLGSASPAGAGGDDRGQGGGCQSVALGILCLDLAVGR